MNKEFNEWWDSGQHTKDNPFGWLTPAFWALEGWQAGVKAEREACAQEADRWQTALHDPRYECDCAAAIRARGQK